MTDLHIGDRVYRLRHRRRVGTIVSFGTYFVLVRKRKRWLRSVNVALRHGAITTWNRRDVRLAKQEAA